MKTYRFKIGGNGYEVTVGGFDGDKAEVTVNGTAYSVILENDKKEKQAAEKSLEQSGTQSAIGNSSLGHGASYVRSPIPGIIVAIKIKTGEHVAKGSTVAVVEAMKMENEILSETDGIVSELKVEEGDSVMEGDIIMRIN